jgi:N-acetylmuramoyl-L-alanine amidase
VGKVISETDSNPYLTRTFLDLSMDKSRAEGYEVSRQVLRQLRQVAILHKKTPQHASLAVLKSPDIPSLLVETGFISNVQEERLLTSSDYQEKIARAIFLGIRAYFHQHPTKGPQLARRNGGGSATASVSSSTEPASSQNVVASRSSSGSGAGVIRPYSEVMHSTSTVSRASSDNDGGSAMATTRHVVKRGESLSKLAERYGVSQNTLVQLNNLRSREIQVGQVIKVPAGSNQEVAASKAPVRHQVKRGESLSKLAERYGVSQARLADYNNLRSREIQIGQVLKIPQE